MRAELDALVAAAAGWDGVAAELQEARSRLQVGEGNGGQFGWFAHRAGIDSEHDRFVTSMIEALEAGQKSLRDMAEVLRRTAQDLGATDTEVADDFHDLDGTPR